MSMHDCRSEALAALALLKQVVCSSDGCTYVCIYVCVYVYVHVYV